MVIIEIHRNPWVLYALMLHRASGYLISMDLCRNPWLLHALMMSWYPSHRQISIYAMRVPMNKACYSWREKSIAAEYHYFFEPLRPPLLPLLRYAP